ncbi:MAG: DoxX family protein [Balneolales bacterium]|nr:DoxX family protein [Balneolales bacterium]
MTAIALFIIIINIAFFLFYGFQCFISAYMKAEFERFGLTSFQRRATGALQILGAVGIIFGFFLPLAGFLASAGLAIMMLMAFLVRIKIRDGFLESTPSLLFLALNSWISLLFYNLM